MTYKNKVSRNALICYLTIVVLFTTIKLLSAFGLLNFLGNYAGLVSTIVVQIGLLFLISIFMFGKLNKTKPKEVFKFYDFNKISFKAIALSFAIGLVVYLLNILVSTFFNAFISLFGYQFSSSETMTSYPFWLLILNLIFTAVLPGICEETAHRGLLLKGFSPSNPRFAILISSLLFGLLHMNVEQVFYATLIGIVLGFVTSISESIYPAMIIHFTNNALSVFMGYSSFHGLGFENIFNIFQKALDVSPIIGIIIMIITIYLLYKLLRFLINKLFISTTGEKMNQMQISILEDIEKKKYLEDVKNLTNGRVDLNIEEQDMQDFFFNQNKKMGCYSEVKEFIFNDKSEFKIDQITKIILITTFVIVASLTLFSFIWGIL